MSSFQPEELIDQMRSYSSVHTFVRHARGVVIVVAWALILLIAWRANLWHISSSQGQMGNLLFIGLPNLA